MRRRGFTLIEIVVAVVLLTFVTLGVVSTLLLASRTVSDAEVRERAVQAVERIVDSLGAVGVTGPGTTSFEWGTAGWETVILPAGGVGPGWVAAATATGGDTLVRVRGTGP